MGEKPVKISTKLPKVDALNGLTTVHEQLCEEDGNVLVIMRIGHQKLTTHPGGVLEPQAYIMRVEGLSGDLAVDGDRLMSRARARRANLEAQAAAPSEHIPGLVLDGGDDDGPPLDGDGWPAGTDELTRLQD